MLKFMRSTPPQTGKLHSNKTAEFWVSKITSMQKKGHNMRMQRKSYHSNCTSISLWNNHLQQKRPKYMLHKNRKVFNFISDNITIYTCTQKPLLKLKQSDNSRCTECRIDNLAYLHFWDRNSQQKKAFFTDCP